MNRYKPDAGYPRIVPVLGYTEVDRATKWLGKFFGFVETLRSADDQGQTVWSELDTGGGVIMIRKVAVSCSDLKSLRRHSARHKVVVFVDDVAAHYARVMTISDSWISSLEEKPEGILEYDIMDYEGNVWTFAQLVREVEPKQWGATEYASAIA